MQYVNISEVTVHKMHTEVIKTILLLIIPRVTLREYHESRPQQHLINFNSVPEDIMLST